MRILLDSHVVVWWCLFPERLSASTVDLLQNPSNEVAVSAASIWELGIKMAKGHLELPTGWVEDLLKDGFIELPVSFNHAQLAATLPMHHSDPFDRLLIAQANHEGMHLVTSDRVISHYAVQRVSP